MWLAITLFLKKYKWFAIGGAVLAGLGIALILYVKIFNSGKNSCIASVLQQTIKITQQLEEQYQKTHARTEKQKNKIRESIKQRPVDDKRDSCLLSADPLRKDCEQYLK